MAIYTRTGDKGQTSIIGGRRDKDDIRIEAYGTVDETNSFVGLAIAQLDPALFQDLLDDLEKIQHELFDCGSDLASVIKERPNKLHQEMVDWLEKRIDALTDEAPNIERFILPGGTAASASLHIARTVARRAERCIAGLMKQDQALSSLPLRYINRLSDYFFAAARIANCRLHVKDVAYVRSARVFRGNKHDTKN
ncbi:cob(I)yrinic acid a,c-diamide adenosyltransferase [Sporolactobacillus nakayamae]|uniref:Corrinoid adenosyltransferase n=1 Tax=Sporolactobacillus nakayamae TaxID=269670 RepID=A0A1I2TCX1_9BACL|nr:cob(I)yrinic acid a,c-diamide adenosyltransferase [Sporolactobacillus nakayamae]SFG60101.1 ATP:cob(I)alamin adenosyltransferase [Sporolactobacillus nakayamae]